MCVRSTADTKSWSGNGNKIVAEDACEASCGAMGPGRALIGTPGGLARWMAHSRFIVPGIGCFSRMGPGRWIRGVVLAPGTSDDASCSEEAVIPCTMGADVRLSREPPRC